MAVQVPSQAAVITATPRDHIAVGGQVEMATSGQKLLAADTVGGCQAAEPLPRCTGTRRASSSNPIADGRACGVIEAKPVVKNADRGGTAVG